MSACARNEAESPTYLWASDGVDVGAEKHEIYDDVGELEHN